METDRYPDLLKEALSRQQRATLPADFSARTLQRLQREKRIREQRAEIMGFVVAAIVSLALIVMAGAILHHYGILPSREAVQEMFVSMKGRAKFFMTESLPYYGVASLAGILLLADYLLRRLWYNNHRKRLDS